MAVWVGFLALFGIATDDETVEDARAATLETGMRPCLMTTATMFVALIPVLYCTVKEFKIRTGMHDRLSAEGHDEPKAHYPD